MWAEMIECVLGLRLDSALLRVIINRFLGRAAVPFLREVATVVSRGLADPIAEPVRVGFSLIEDIYGGRGWGERWPRTSKFSHETFQFHDPIPKSGDFVDFWIFTDPGIINFVNAETGLMVIAV